MADRDDESPPDRPHLRLVPEPQPAGDDSEPERAAAARWLRRAEAFREVPPRLNLLVRLLRTDRDLFAALFERVRGATNESSGRMVYLDMVRLLSGARRLPYALREELYVTARRRSLPLLRLLVLGSRRAPPGDLWLDDADLEQRTLGERKTLARTGDLDLLMRLSVDPDPRVVTELLRHPRLTQAIALRAAARRPAHPAALTAIIHHPRWGAQPALIEAVARNPHAAPGLAAALLPLLGEPILRAIHRGSAGQEMVRAAAASLLGDDGPLDALLA